MTVTLPPEDQFPVPANRKLWAAETFANDLGSTSSNAEVNFWSQGYFNPPTIGSSADLMFQTTSAFDGFSSDPDGALFNWGGNPVVANFGWQLQAPKPASMSIMGLALLGLARRDRRAGGLSVFSGITLLPQSPPTLGPASCDRAACDQSQCRS